MKDTPQDKDFLWHLYDKLWENIIHKENRLWTFLAVYGAAIGILIGTGAKTPLKFASNFVLLLLSCWAVEIIIDADWWSVRNRLMVRGIERRLMGTTAGVIPSKYHKPAFSSGTIYNASILVFALIGVMVFALSTGSLKSNWQIVSVLDFVGICLLYTLMLAAAWRCLFLREKRISEYYEAFWDLRTQERNSCPEITSHVADQDLIKAERDDRRTLGWRIVQIPLLYAVVTALVAISYYRGIARAGNGVLVSVFILSQAIVAGSYVFGLVEFKNWSRKPEQKADKKTHDGGMPFYRRRWFVPVGLVVGIILFQVSFNVALRQGGVPWLPPSQSKVEHSRGFAAEFDSVSAAMREVCLRHFVSPQDLVDIRKELGGLSSHVARIDSVVAQHQKSASSESTRDATRR